MSNLVQTFESIEICAFVPPSRDNMRDEVFVKVNIEKATNHLHFNKAKLGTGAKGNLFPLRLYCHMFPQSLMVDGLPKCGAPAYSPTILSAHDGAKLTQGSHSLEKSLNSIFP